MLHHADHTSLDLGKARRTYAAGLAAANFAGGTMKRIFALALLALCAAAPASAQEWPAKTVRVIVPFGAGATPDTIARLVADRLQQKLGQNFIVENKPGASGMTGTDTVAKAEPDGHTIRVSIGGAGAAQHT